MKIYLFIWLSITALVSNAEDQSEFKTCLASDIEWGADGASPVVMSMYPRCSRLDLGNSRMRDAHVEALVNALESFGGHLKEIRMQRNFIGDDGAIALGRYLLHSSVSILHLSSNFIKDEGASALATVMKKHEHDKGSPLAELHLANNEIGPEGCEYLAQALEENKYLKVLVLNHNPIEDDGVDSLASAAKTSVLRDLKITQCRISDSAAKMIGSLMGSDGSLLQVLDLGLNGISDSGAIAIAEGLGRNTHMTTLMLTGAPSSMRDTDGEWGLIGDAGAVAIAKALMGNTHSKLQILDLSRGNIGDIGARAIGEMLQDDQHLRVLKLQENMISDDGAVGLGAGTRGHGVLEELHLRSNNIHDEGASALLHSLKRNPQIHQLVLHDNMVASSILERVREVLHMEPEAREVISTREKKGDEELVEVEIFDNSVNELYAVFEVCGIESIFDSVHDELGVETLSDLQHIEFEDLHGASGLSPMDRTELVTCICETQHKYASDLCGHLEL